MKVPKKGTTVLYTEIWGNHATTLNQKSVGGRGERGVGNEMYERREVRIPSGAPNENIVQNHLNIALLNVF